jgi:hypothetical protein
VSHRNIKRESHQARPDHKPEAAITGRNLKASAEAREIALAINHHRQQQTATTLTPHHLPR